ncbi:MAG: hypothetical protein LBI04_09725 [Treponema sp.]|jgi:hypothetical protein|nr:hypothetical protein [Treponema sp.]
MTEDEQLLENTFFSEELSVSENHQIFDTDYFEKPEIYLPISPYSLALLEKVKSAFKNAGWEGTGDLGIMYVKPFTVNLPPDKVSHDKTGSFIWHVKEADNGKSFIGTYPKSLKSVAERSETISVD